MAETMKQLVFAGPRKTKIIEVPKPEPKDGEVLIRLTLTGMCRSEWHPWTVAEDGKAFGHEWTGVVEKLRAAGYDTGMAHCCNSHAFVRHPEMHMDGVRIGSAFLGRLAFKDKLGLQRIGYAECTLEEIRWIPKGQTIGYAAGFKAPRQMRTAVIGLGWYNGFAASRENDIFRIRDSIGGILHHLKNLLFPRRILVEVKGEFVRRKRRVRPF